MGSSSDTTTGQGAELPSLAAVQEFPEALPRTLPAETISLESLVHHHWAVDDGLSLELVEKIFRERQVDFLALLKAEKVIGICSRLALGSLMASRYGFALYGGSAARLVQVEHPLIFSASTPINEVLDRSMARTGDEFHEDVALVDAEGKLIGLIAVEALAHFQTKLVDAQLGELRRQHGTLSRQNVDLFQANHALRQTQGLYRGLFESNTLGVALLDTRGQVQAHNRRLVELLNLGEAPVLIPSLDGWMNERDRLQFSCLLAALERQSEAASPSTREFLLQLPGRGSRLFRFTTGWIRETGQICACLDDITEQRDLERNVMRQEKQRLLDTLVGGIAHELNNKLTPILGFADLLAGGSDPATSEPAAVIARSATEASRIIRQLLQLSKPESGDPHRIDLRAVVEEALLMLKFQVRERGCAVQLALPPEPVVVRVDPAQIKQVLMNLVLNSLQAMESAAAPAINLAVGRGPAGAFVTVSDNGVGIPAENLGRIFDPFFTTKSPDRGSGLGLSICFSIARQYGGNITVESPALPLFAGQSQPGSTFTLTLPLETGLAERIDGRAPAPAPLRTALPVLRVLIAEDEEVVRKVLQEMLRAVFHCQVDLASNGAEALALADRHHYDLVISDIRMPVMAGTEFYLRLRETHPDLIRHFIFITGHPGEQSLRDEIARWNVPVLGKPFTVNRLDEVCRPMLDPADLAAETG